MISATWKDVRDGSAKVPQDHAFYIVRDGEHVFYVGFTKSTHLFPLKEGATQRIRSRFHRLRPFLDYHHPTSDTWIVDFLTLDDVAQLLNKGDKIADWKNQFHRRRIRLEEKSRYLNQREVEWEERSIVIDERRMYWNVESLLITHCKPYLNIHKTIGYTRQKLPEQYNVPSDLKRFYHLKTR